MVHPSMDKNGWLEEECVPPIEACSLSKKILNSTKIECLGMCCSNNDLELSTQLFQLITVSVLRGSQSTSTGCSLQ